MDTTVEILTGATIYRCERIGTSLDLLTSRGRVIVAGARTGIELVCPKCRECRLTEIVETAGRQVGVCQVCAHAWKLESGKG